MTSTNGTHDVGLPTTSGDDRRLLLRTAREAAATFLTGQNPPRAASGISARFGGAFVTLLRGDRLRGCVGSFEAISDAVRTIQSVTVSSLQDSRFATCPVTLAELAELTIEISLVSSPCPVRNPASLIPGVHGIVVTRGDLSGCFLPKVAAERNWSIEEFLSNCCTMKAGLPADAWKDDGTSVLSFRAEVFNDRDPAGVRP